MAIAKRKKIMRKNLMIEETPPKKLKAKKKKVVEIEEDGDEEDATVQIAELRAGLKIWLDRAISGKKTIIYRGERAIAKLVPLDEA